MRGSPRAARKAPSDGPARDVRNVLEGYAERGVFRSVSQGDCRGGRTRFMMVWHHGRTFRLDCSPSEVTFPALLPGLTARSPLVRDLKAFLHRFETDEVPPHRRVDRARARLQIALRGGNVSVGLAVRHGEFEYCTRRLIHLVQEVFMVFLPDGPYQEYRVQQLGLDPEAVWV